MLFKIDKDRYFEIDDRFKFFFRPGDYAPELFLIWCDAVGYNPVEFLYNDVAHIPHKGPVAKKAIIKIELVPAGPHIDNVVISIIMDRTIVKSQNSDYRRAEGDAIRSLAVAAFIDYNELKRTVTCA